MGGTVAVPLHDAEAKGLESTPLTEKADDKLNAKTAHDDAKMNEIQTEKGTDAHVNEEKPRERERDRDREGERESHTLAFPSAEAKHTSSPTHAHAHTHTRRATLLETMLLPQPSQERLLFQPSPDHLTVGDIVRVHNAQSQSQLQSQSHTHTQGHTSPTHKQQSAEEEKTHSHDLDHSHDSSMLSLDEHALAHDELTQSHHHTHTHHTHHVHTHTHAHTHGRDEGIIIEMLSPSRVLVDFGDACRSVLLADCTLLLRSDEFEVGDKVEAKPLNSNLFFVGRVIHVDPVQRRLDVLMDGDDPEDIERDLPFENARKLASRRTVVVNRWKRAFMMIVAANFFKEIPFDHSQVAHRTASSLQQPRGDAKYEDDKHLPSSPV